MTEAGEYRVSEAMSSWARTNSIHLDVSENHRFICTHVGFHKWAEDRKQLRMEYFYRNMRSKTGLLMDGDKPEGGQWNFDAENRKPASNSLMMQHPSRMEADMITNEVLDLVEECFPENFVTLRPFWFGVTREGALEALDAFIKQVLPYFGDFQDAMLENERFLFHSVLAQYINAGLLQPLEVCHKVEAAWYSGHAPLNTMEGYIRQIIGWREYVRGIYWLKMPGYTEENFFDATRALPGFYWTGETDMACMATAIAANSR
jgi:deoxyribodipyrimidine photolyase-related protein